MQKMTKKYISWMLSALMCFNSSFTLIQAEEETVPEEPEVLETVEEQQEPEEVSENEVISDQALSAEPALDEETVLTDTELETTEESDTPKMMEESQTELFADQEDTTWQNDFNYKLENGHLILYVPNGQYSCYNGSSTDVTIPAQAVIDGVSYITELAIMAFYNESTIINLSFEEGVILPEDCVYLFGSSQLETLDISRLDTSHVTNMSYMFSGCQNLITLIVGDPDTSNVTNMSGMFSGCFALTSIDVSKFETGNVTNMSSMFQSCSSLKSLDLSALDTRNVTDMSDMFRYSSALAAIDVNGLDTDNVTNMSNMFSGCKALTALDVSGFDTGNVTNMNSMFYDCRSLAAIDISMLNTEKVTDMSGMFYNSAALTSISINGINTSNVTNMSRMFYGCKGLGTLDISGLNTGNATNMSNMFFGCSGLTSLDVSRLNTGNVTNMSGLFSGCSGLTTLDVNKLNTSNVTNMSGMFRGCSSLTTLDISKLNTANVTDMSELFCNSAALTSISINGIDTSNVTNMSRMFSGCSGLTSFDVSGLNAGNVTNMEGMFGGCRCLTALDISMLDTSKVTNMSYMFSNSGLTELVINGINTSSVTSMYYMFSVCRALTTLDISGLDTGNVKNMSSMFESCSALTALNISGINTSSVTNISNMFYDCYKLSELNLYGLDMANVNRSDYVFMGLASDVEEGGNLYLPVSFPEIKKIQFNGAKLKNIYYPGSEEEWNVLVGNNSIPAFENANIHFNYVPGSEEDPDDQQVEWEYNNVTYTMIIQGTGAMADYSDEEVPWNDIRDSILSAVIGSNFESIGSCALQNIEHLKRVYIPVSVTEIRENAFNNTPELQDIYFAGTQEQWEAVVIGDGNSSLSTATVHYLCPYDFATVWEFDPETSALKISGNGPMMDLQDTSAPWYIFKDQITTIVVKEGITAIGAYTFKDITNLNRMYIPLSAIKFNEYALDNDQLLLDIYYTGTEEQWGNIVAETGNDVLFSDTLTVHYNSPYEETESEETIVQIKRNDAWYDALTIKQTYYLGKDEEAEIRIIPAPKYNNVGFIALKRGMETLHACFPEDGIITFVPGKELAVGDTLKIVLCTIDDEAIEELDLLLEIVEESVKTFTVSYCIDGVVEKTAVYHTGSEIQKPEDPVKEGSIFKGWYTNVQGTGIDFFDPGNVRNKNKVQADITLYGKFRQPSFDYIDMWSFNNDAVTFCAENYNSMNADSQKRFKYEIKKEDYSQLLSLLDGHPIQKNRLTDEKESEWSGSCFGMAASAVLMYLKYFEIRSFDSNIEDVRDAKIYLNPSGDDDVGNIESMINFYQLLQKIDPLNTAQDQYNRIKEFENLETIIKIMENENKPVVLNVLVYNNLFKHIAHSVVAYDFQKINNDEFYFKIYDNAIGRKAFEVKVYRNDFGIYTAEHESWDGDWRSNLEKAGGQFSRIFLKNVTTADEIASTALLTNPGVITKRNAKKTAGTNTDTAVVLQTGYSSFSVTNGSGTANVSDMEVISDSIGGVVSKGQTNSLYGHDRFLFELPVLSEGDSYTIIPSDSNSDNYKTVFSYENLEDGFFVLVDADRAGTITVDRYGKVTTNYNTDTLQKIRVCSEKMTTPWYTVEFEGTSTGFTAEAVNGTVQSASAANVNVAVESDFNRYEISNVSVDTDGVQVVEGDNLTCEVISGNEIIGGGTFGYSVVFDSSLGSNVQALRNVPAGSTIQKPEDPTREGYVFEGWYKEKTFETEWDFNTDEVTNDLVLYAGWSIDEDYLVTVTFKIPETNDAVVYLGKNTILDADKYPSSQESTGYKWYTDPELTDEWNKTAPFTEDTILYAGEAEPLADYGEVLAEDIPADGIIPEGIWTAGIKDQTYAGSAIKQNFRVYDGTSLLKEKTDYTITYKNNTNVYTFEGDRSSFIPAKKDKTPYILITGKGNYSGKTYVPFSIDQVNINDPDKVYIEESITLKANGKVQRPVPVITYNGKTVSSKEYTLYYYDEDGQEQNKKTGPKTPGSYTIVVVANGKNFTADREIQMHLTIAEETSKEKTVALSKAITFTAANAVYDGTAKETASVTAKAGYVLTEGTDYTIAYSNNTKAGTATVTATGKGIYTGTMKKTFKIAPDTNAHTRQITVEPAVYAKGGSKPKVTVEGLTEGKDYTVKYGKNNTAGKTGTATVAFTGNYKGSKSVPLTFDISQKDLSKITITAKDLVYKKGKYQSTPVLTDTDGKKLKAGVDYEKTYEYTGDIIDGDAQPGSVITVTVTGKGNYTDTATATYRILEAGKDISKATFKIANQEYTGSEIRITDMSQFTETNGLKNAYITVNKQKEYLILGEDFEVVPGSYVKNVNKGTAKVTFRGIYPYGGEKTVSFKIGQRSITSYWKGIFSLFGNMF